MAIIIPFGKANKKITITIDDNGNSKIEAIDLRNFLHVPGAAERPLPLSALETLYWMTKCAADALAATIKQIDSAAGRGAPSSPSGLINQNGGPSDDNEKKTD